jgi:DNA-binding CsgD family transcriptional regulator
MAHHWAMAAPTSMKKSILLYGVLGGVLIALLRLIEYRFLVVEHSVEIYGGLIAALFAALGIWLGLKLTTPRETVVFKEVIVPAAQPFTSEPFAADARRLEALRITPRELEILQLIAAGLSNREIAGRIFVSENTVKTHSSRLFDKLNARRRTQAVQIGKELGLLP